MRFIIELLVLAVTMITVAVSMAYIGSSDTRADVKKIVLEINGALSQVDPIGNNH